MRWAALGSGSVGNGTGNRAREARLVGDGGWMRTTQTVWAGIGWGRIGWEKTPGRARHVPESPRARERRLHTTRRRGQRLVAVCGGTSTAEDERVETERGAGNAGNLPSDSRRVRAGRRLEAALWRPLPLAPIGPRPDVPATAAAVTWRCPISRVRPAPAENPGLPIFADVPPPVVACGPSLPAIAGAWRCSCTGCPSLASRHRPRDGHGPRAWWDGRQHAASQGRRWRGMGSGEAGCRLAGRRRPQAAAMQGARLPASARAWT